MGPGNAARSGAELEIIKSEKKYSLNFHYGFHDSVSNKLYM